MEEGIDLKIPDLNKKVRINRYCIEEVSVDDTEVSAELMYVYNFIKRYKTLRYLYLKFLSNENLERLYIETIKLDTLRFDIISEKLGFKVYGIINENRAGDIKYTVKSLDNENIVFNHYVTFDGKSFGEINSDLIINGMSLIYNLPQTLVKNWKEEDIEILKSVGEDIADNLEKLLFSKIKIQEGKIIQSSSPKNKIFIKQKANKVKNY